MDNTHHTITAPRNVASAGRLLPARHPAYFQNDLGPFGLLANRAIQPRVAQKSLFDEVAEARPLRSAVGKLVLCPEL
jgi:hypothetical protein